MTLNKSTGVYYLFRLMSKIKSINSTFFFIRPTLQKKKFLINSGSEEILIKLKKHIMKNTKSSTVGFV